MEKNKNKIIAAGVALIKQIVWHELNLVAWSVCYRPLVRLIRANSKLKLRLSSQHLLVTPRAR